MEQGESDPPRRPGLLGHGIRSARKIAVGIVGVSVVVVGIALLVLPGPGVLTILVGLGILSMEFAFAYQMIAWVRARANSAADRAEIPTRWRRIIPVAALAFSILAMIAPLMVGIVETPGGLRVLVKPEWTYRHFFATESGLHTAAADGDALAARMLQRLSTPSISP